VTANPEQSVLKAISALEQDEIGELVSWQLEEGRRRGDGPDEDAAYSLPLLGSPDDLNWRRPIAPAPTLREPTGTWWRCDQPQHLEVEIHVERSLECHTTGWTITVAGERVVDCVVRRGDADRLCPFRIGTVTGSVIKRPEWFAVRSPQPPREGDWRAWNPAALVPVR
jgi:hypothetical protein